MLILHPVETFVELFWEDFKENKREWLVLLLWTLPTDIAWDLTLWAVEKIRDRYKRRADNSL